MIFIKSTRQKDKYKDNSFFILCVTRHYFANFLKLFFFVNCFSHFKQKDISSKFAPGFDHAQMFITSLNKYISSKQTRVFHLFASVYSKNLKYTFLRKKKKNKYKKRDKCSGSFINNVFKIKIKLL